MTQALGATDKAEQLSVDLEDVSELKEEHKKLLQCNSVNNQLPIFKLPYNNLCVKSFTEDATTPYIHIMKGKVIDEFIPKSICCMNIEFF